MTKWLTAIAYILSLNYVNFSETSLEPCQTSIVERFCENKSY